LRPAEITRRVLVTIFDVYTELGTGFKTLRALNWQPPDTS
jgi:hypothetical protein